jgi:hypothetical protein
MAYIKNIGGHNSRDSYPYIQNDGPCKFRTANVIAKVSAVAKVTDIAGTLSKGPIPLAV